MAVVRGLRLLTSQSRTEPSLELERRRRESVLRQPVYRGAMTPRRVRSEDPEKIYRLTVEGHFAAFVHHHIPFILRASELSWRSTAGLSPGPTLRQGPPDP